MLGVSLILKRWNPMFDVDKEKSNWDLVWVYLPQLPLHFWNVESFEMIGNYLGKFLNADNSYDIHEHMRMARVLLNLDTRLGCLEEINLEINGGVHTQILDYKGIVFHQIRSHALDQLVAQCKEPLKVKELGLNLKEGFARQNVHLRKTKDVFPIP